MSTLLDRPVETTRPQPAARPVGLQPKIRVEPDVRPIRHRPVETPLRTPSKAPSETLVEIPRKATKKGASVGVGFFVLTKAMLFLAFFSLSYVASTLSGHYLVEKSRNMGIAASTRATVALQSEREVQRRIDVLTSASAIEDWALSHSFRPTDGLGQTSRVVNLVPTNR